MGEAPAFQFYPTDFLSDAAVMAMTLEERGAYITLLCIAWTEGGIPASEDRLCRLLRISRRRLEGLWPALEAKWQTTGNGSLVNPRMERVRTELRLYQQRQSKAGKKGAEARWG